jgi:hypothetical protein
MRGLHRRVDLRAAVRGRDEERLELGRGDVHAAGEQVPKPRAVALRVARGRLLEAPHRPLPEEERRHAADTLHGDSLPCRRLPEARGELRPGGLQLLVDGGITQAPEDDERRRGGERVPGQRAGLVDGARGRELVHELGGPAERRERQPAARDLAQDRQVGPDAVQLLRAAPGNAEAGDHLVEDEQGAGGGAERAQRLEEAGLRRDDAHVPGHGLDDDRRELVAVPLDRGRDALGVVVGADDRVRGRAGRDARRGRDPEGREPGARRREQRVGVAVVAARELEDAVAAGRAAREPERAHRRLRPGGDEPHLLDRGNGVDELLGERHFALRRRAVGRSCGGGLLYGLDHLGIGVAEDERAPGEDPVEIAVALGIPEVSALAALGEERLAGADGAPGTHGGVDPARNHPGRALIERASSHNHSASSRAQ